MKKRHRHKYYPIFVLQYETDNDTFNAVLVGAKRVLWGCECGKTKEVKVKK